MIRQPELFKRYHLRAECCKTCQHHYRYGKGGYFCKRMSTYEHVRQYWVCDLYESTIDEIELEFGRFDVD